MASLSEYQRKRDAGSTPEPTPAGSESSGGDGDSFVIQEHHARALHWDFRLERDGVLVSWALPKGLPDDPKINHLAVHVEDHPLEYGSFEGTIGAGQYGAGTVSIWDRGSYQIEKWTEREVIFVLAGTRAQGRFALFRTKGKNWMIHRMDAPARPGWQPAPKDLAPMLASPGALPPAKDDALWAYEMKWDGMRAIARVDGGRLTLHSRNAREVTVSFPELRPLAEHFGTSQAVLDGEIVCFDDRGRPDFGRLQERMHVSSARQAQSLAATRPVVLLAFDLLHFDGESLLELPYSQRRERLESLELDGPNWQTPPAFQGTGAEAVRTSQELGLEGVMAKRLRSAYRPGKRSKDWIKVKNIRTQEVLVGGWTPGKGNRSGTIGALLLGLPDQHGLRYIGKVGTGFTQRILDELAPKLRRLERKTSPFETEVPRPDARLAHWCTPQLVGEVAFSEWTGDGRLRHPTWRGLRPDKHADEVALES
ncbi:MAG TPA: non-homologous end-joining DNA ligase [Jatrophihabitans sp.]|nr:non-homologous end-joining DNA ligase [Jatrophihabitans sp.]